VKGTKPHSPGPAHLVEVHTEGPWPVSCADTVPKRLLGGCFGSIGRTLMNLSSWPKTSPARYLSLPVG